MSFAYQNVQDANQHLLGTVVMFEGSPAYISAIDTNPQDPNGFVAHISHLPRLNNTFTVDLFHPSLEPKGLKLGYVNVSAYGQALFCTRIPARQYHQGLCRQNVHIPNDPSGRRLVNFDHLMREAGFVDALRGIYPTFQQAQELLENPAYQSMAFHRLYALAKDELGFFRLYFRGEPVAFGEGNRFRLAKKNHYLASELAEFGIEVE